MPSNIDLRHLETFLVVVEEMSFGRAAERLRIAQPPLSRQIQRLEDALDVRLFDRTRPQIQLTEAGRAFVPEARQILRQVERGVQVAQRASRGEVGQLLIGFEGSLSSDIVPLSISSYQQQFPEVSVTVQEMPTGDQLQALLKEQIDLGFIVPRVADEALVVETVAREPLVLALSEDHPLAVQDEVEIQQLRNEKFITGSSVDRCGLHRAINDVCYQAGFIPNVSQVTNEIQLTLGFIAAGIGIALLPNSIRGLQKDGVVYRPVKPATAASSLAIAWPQNHSNPALTHFLQVVRAIANSTSNGSP